MIQRIQSIFLFLASGAFFSLFGLPFATTEAANTSLLDDKVFEIFDNPILIALTVIGGAVAFLNIFMFKNRGLQLRLGFLVIICSIILVVLSGVIFFQESQDLPVQSSVEEGLGIWPVLAALILTILANYFIKKDEKLVRSADRLR